jgi:DNA transformation protein
LVIQAIAPVDIRLGWNLHMKKGSVRGGPQCALDVLRGLGPKSRAELARLGIHTAAHMRAADAVRLYLRVKAQWPGASLNLLYALVGAQEGRDWREIARERRTELLLRLDDLGHAP